MNTTVTYSSANRTITSGEATRSPLDDRLSWIHELNKQALVTEKEKHGLHTEGTVARFSLGWDRNILATNVGYPNVVLTMGAKPRSIVTESTGVYCSPLTIPNEAIQLKLSPPYDEFISPS